MDWREHFFFEAERRTVTEGAVTAVGIVEGLDVIENQETGGSAGGRDLAAEAFGLEGGDEAFGQGIIVGIARAAHAAGDAPGGRELDKVCGGVLHLSLIHISEPTRPY